MSTAPGPVPSRRSAFTAAFLSSLFPGLGHLYARAYYRALGFAALPILLIALGGGIFLRVDRFTLLGVALDNLFFIQVANVLFLFYRIVAAIDAYRVTVYLNGLERAGHGRYGAPRSALSALSLAGLIAVLLVTAAPHGVVAYYDAQAERFINCVFDDTGTANCDDQGPGASDSPEPTDTLGPGDSIAGPSTSAGGPTVEPTPLDTPGAGTAPPLATLPPYNPTDTLNILLVGADRRGSSKTFNTDTLIVVSIDPVSKKVAMFSLPRDTVDVPLPPGRARSVYGTTYGGKINSLYNAALRRPDIFPGNDRQRGYAALKQTLGYLYGLQIRWYVQVDFKGFKRVIDTLGGVTINVQIPVMDDKYPGDDGRVHRVYIPAGIQHMDGETALIYARSRHGKYGFGSNDFDRGQRQQRVILSVRQQADIPTVVSRLPDLISALSAAVQTDIPRNQLPQLLSLANSVDLSNVRSYVFAPSTYATSTTEAGRGYIIKPYIAKIRTAVDRAFRGGTQTDDVDQALADENAAIWVLNGTGDSGQSSRVAGYLESRGMAASAPNRKADSKPSNTVIKVYNGAEESLTQTLALLSQIFKVKWVAVDDPSVTADVVITTGAKTPYLVAPPAP